MGRSRYLVCSLFAFAACSSAPAPTAPVAPAPVVEIALPMTVVMEEPDVDASYVRTDIVEHTWRVDGAGRVRIAFQLSCSTRPGCEEDLQVMLKLNWVDACEQARRLCEGCDVTTDEGLQKCSESLCESLTETLFGDCDDPSMAQVARVIWKRVVWS